MRIRPKLRFSVHPSNPAMGMLSSSAPSLTARCRSHNPQRRIFQLAREARLARRRPGEAQAHERVARCTDQVIAQFYELASIAVIQAKFLEPVGKMPEDFQAAGLSYDLNAAPKRLVSPLPMPVSL